ncbi:MULTISPECIES: circularly permuted type 2 ATP-grasp protein [Paracoccus]|uniref:Putative circularly permuted ATP-grasp superfamily protein n=1 Tax=Paracoccus versutus TaxID=34007 RepID=A0A3D9XXL3_PARVE|nr:MULTISPECIES: circularly permuted type 2 ATP-grasp protein [Paracoccus]WGR62828.1 circularly permuted type 2 ATP-grasp protein [Paracoccus ferrooxidans]MBT0781205.1 circularly permuted type 2 ATP-grasp protein [Paracoccus sp. pheM1]MCJ1901801.1 circularly permuted type 2 ATP-grasp protein [Paracoccus versutus]MDF3906648.1 circularly permuted type 2 ATP-grasp protein [Paracoccus sp. AS002]REF73002.1 putative circularly permuted ATP-grasp superfamily protein [Paracoccus versutus]
MTMYYNEMVDGGRVREPYAMLSDWIEAMPAEIRQMKQAEAEALFRRIGITFAVYGEGGDPDRLIPFDMMPRVFLQSEWRRLERGIKQRARALNAFLRDVYGRGEIVRAGRIPARLVYQNAAYEKAVVGFVPPRGVFSHIVGIDIVRTGRDEFYVLEDNCRTPSGVSYMLENREIMMRMFPALFRNNCIEPVDQYPELLRRTLASVAPAKCDGPPTVVILTPGHYNSAYYEHSFLANLMGVELVEGSDLFVDGGFVYMRTTQGPKRVDVIYRRIDDQFLDPLCFRRDSMLGVPGLMDVYRSGGVSIASAPGAGVADDKAVYTFVPEMIRFYLGEEPILRNVQTWTLWKDEDYRYVMANLKDLVVKEVHGSGGYGMLIGPCATQAEIEAFALRIQADPGNYIAQPVLALSTSPTFVDEGVAPRHVDLRPFCLCGDRIELVPGGLTRVALREGSLVVNSSQGGGVKDTWILSE